MAVIIRMYSNVEHHAINKGGYTNNLNIVAQGNTRFVKPKTWIWIKYKCLLALKLKVLIVTGELRTYNTIL